MIAISNEAKVCKSCRRQQPIGEFRRRSRGAEARLNQCRTCHREAERCRRAGMRAKRDGRQVEQFATSAGRTRDLSEVAAMLGMMYEKFGGLNGFVEGFYTEYLAAPPGSYRRTKMLLMILQLTELNTVRENAERVARQSEYNLMSDEELEEERMHICGESIVKMVVAQPELAVWAAEELGWTVIPPDESPQGA